MRITGNGLRCVRVTILLNQRFYVLELRPETLSESTRRMGNTSMTSTTRAILALLERCRKSLTSSKRISFLRGLVLIVVLFLELRVRYGHRATDTMRYSERDYSSTSRRLSMLLPRTRLSKSETKESNQNG